MQTDVVPELVKMKIDSDPTKASFLGVLQKGQKRRKIMSMVGGFGGADEEIQIEDDDPFLAVQKDLKKGL